MNTNADTSVAIQNLDDISEKQLLRKGRAERLRRGIGFILLATVFIVLAMTIHRVSGLWLFWYISFWILVWVLIRMLWYSYYQLPVNWHGWKEGIKAGRWNEYSYAMAVYDVLREYSNTKRVFTYGSLTGVAAILFAAATMSTGAAPDIQWMLIAIAALGAAIVLLSYQVGRQLLPAEALITQFLQIHCAANTNAGDNDETLKKRINNALTRIKKEHPLWFRRGS